MWVCAIWLGCQICHTHRTKLYGNCYLVYWLFSIISTLFHNSQFLRDALVFFFFFRFRWKSISIKGAFALQSHSAHVNHSHSPSSLTLLITCAFNKCFQFAHFFHYSFLQFSPLLFFPNILDYSLKLFVHIIIIALFFFFFFFGWLIHEGQIRFSYLPGEKRCTGSISDVTQPLFSDAIIFCRTVLEFYVRITCKALTFDILAGCRTWEHEFVSTWKQLNISIGSNGFEKWADIQFDMNLKYIYVRGWMGLETCSLWSHSNVNGNDGIWCDYVAMALAKHFPNHIPIAEKLLESQNMPSKSLHCSAIKCWRAINLACSIFSST